MTLHLTSRARAALGADFDEAVRRCFGSTVHLRGVAGDWEARIDNWTATDPDPLSAVIHLMHRFDGQNEDCGACERAWQFWQGA